MILFGWAAMLGKRCFRVVSDTRMTKAIKSLHGSIQGQMNWIMIKKWMLTYFKRTV